MRAKRTRRRLLTAGVGVAALTAAPGLACGNPVAPSYEPQPDILQPRATASESPNPLEGPIIPESTAASSASAATPGK